MLQAPLFVNAVFHLPLKHGFMPFAGVGAGAAFSWLDIDDFDIAGAGTTRIDGATTEVSFAYQGFAGVRWQLSRGGQLALAYRFMSMGKPRWSLEDDITGSKVASLKADNIYSHQLTLGFSLGF
jgi:opacity protein-like surface antigen